MEQQGLIMELLGLLRQTAIDTIDDVLPVLAVIIGFQVVILRQRIPNLKSVLIGFVYVLIGLTLFLVGLEEALFPLGKLMATQLTDPEFIFGTADAIADVMRWDDYLWVYLFAAAIGFSATIAEPALIAVADEAAAIAAQGNAIEDTKSARQNYAFGLRLTVAVSVGFALIVGVFRILKGWPIQYLILGGYCGVVIMTIFAPEEIIGIAYDSGGVTTSTITVPLVTALGVGLASSIKGRNPMIDGFGLIAFASLTPMIFVMAYGMLI